jgi:hypothetical protein
MNDLSSGSASARTESTVAATRQLENPVDADAVEIGPDGQSVSKVDKADKEKADKEKAEKDKAEKDKAEKDKAEKDKTKNDSENTSTGNGSGQSGSQSGEQSSNNSVGSRSLALSTSTNAVAPGGNVDVTLMNGSGGANQWIALASVGAPDTSYLLSIPVGPGVTSRVWTVRMPTTAGPYEFRLFLNGNRGNALRGGSRNEDAGVPKAPPNQTTRAATSRTVMVGSSTPPVIGNDPTPPIVGNDPPVVGNDPPPVVPNNPPPAPPVVVDEQPAPPPVVVNDPPPPPPPVVVEPPAPPPPPVVVEPPPPPPPVVVEPPPPPPPPVVEPPPSTDPAISVSSQNVSVGTRINATLINGTGDPYDWLVLAPVGSPDTEYWDWTYVPGGMATYTWGVTMPMAGTYEIRLLLHGGYTKVATSPQITVK